MTAIMWLLVFSTGLSAADRGAQECDEIVGLWTVRDGEARIEIRLGENGAFEGYIAWQRQPNYPDGDPEAGTPRHDRENPDPALRNRPLAGLKILEGFVYKGDHVWKNGTVYSPENGRTYKCKLTIKDADHLDLRGFIGISVLGKTEHWTRYKGKADGDK